MYRPHDTTELHGTNKDRAKRLQVNSLIGKLVLVSNSHGYETILGGSHSFPKIQDEIEIVVQNDIELATKATQLYNNPRNAIKIPILYGSGSFRVHINDTSVATYDYNEQDRSITIRPLRRGFVRVTVEDNKLESSKQAFCDIAVSTAQSIRLITQTNLLQESARTKMHVEIYDEFGKVFDPEQYHLMTTELHIDTDSEFVKTNALRITPVDNSSQEFYVQGLQTGDYKLVASMVNQRLMDYSSSEYRSSEVSGQRRILSNPVDLNVYPKLQVRPAAIYLAPGCITSFDIVGGPSEKSKSLNNVELESTVSRGDIIDLKKVDINTYEVRALHSGDTDIKFKLKYRDSGVVIAETVVKTRVGTISNVEVLGMLNRNLHVGTTVRLIAAGITP